MILTDWEIWHTFSTYFLGNQPPLEVAARNLVRSGLATCAVLKDGQFFWKSDDQIERGSARVELTPDGTGARIQLAPRVPSGYAGEAVVQAFYFRYGEIRLFGENSPLPPAYLRAYMGECVLTAEQQHIRMYPIITLYETGVVLVEMRMIAPGNALKDDDFIAHYINIYGHRFDRVVVPPALVSLTHRAYWFYRRKHWPIWWRAALLYLGRHYDREIAEITEKRRDGDFDFELAPLWERGAESTETQRQDQHSDAIDTYTALTQSIVNAVGVAIQDQRSLIPFVIRGPRLPQEIGNYWSSRPHTHLLRFKNQHETASQNEKTHSAALARMIFRVPGENAKPGSSLLPQNARSFDDYAAYIGSHMTLWVWAKTGLRRQQPWADKNRGHLIYEHQITAELLEYGHLLHKRLVEEIELLDDSHAALKARKDIVRLQGHMADAGHFGELRQLFQAGWRLMGVSELREQIKELLTIQHDRITIRQESQSNRWGAFLTIAFGVLAIPSFATEVLSPLWLFIGLPLPTDSSLAKLTLVSVTAAVFGVGMGLMWFRFLRVTSPREIRKKLVDSSA